MNAGWALGAEVVLCCWRPAALHIVKDLQQNWLAAKMKTCPPGMKHADFCWQDWSKLRAKQSSQGLETGLCA